MEKNLVQVKFISMMEEFLKALGLKTVLMELEHYFMTMGTIIKEITKME